MGPELDYKTNMKWMKFTLEQVQKFDIRTAHPYPNLNWASSAQPVGFINIRKLYLISL